MSAVAERTDAAAFVEAFAAGWRAPTSMDAVTERFLPLMHPDVRLVQPQMPVVNGRHNFRRGMVEPLFTLVPDLHGEVLGWAAHDDVVFIELELSGTLGGRPIAFVSCDKITLRDGLIAERIAYMDPAPLLAAALARPRAWPAAARMQLRTLRQRLGRQT